jgi:hypothetical protein
LKKLYVGNLPFQATEEELRNWFKQAAVTAANVMLVQTASRGSRVGSASSKSTAMMTLTESSWSTRLVHAVKTKGAVVAAADVVTAGESVTKQREFSPTWSRLLESAREPSQRMPASTKIIGNKRLNAEHRSLSRGISGGIIYGFQCNIMRAKLGE